MESPRAQDVINDLRSDPFANGILNRVQAGPYVSSDVHSVLPIDNINIGFEECDGAATGYGTRELLCLVRRQLRHSSRKGGSAIPSAVSRLARDSFPRQGEARSRVLYVYLTFHPDPTAMATPTKEWQEQLARKLAHGNQRAYPNASMSPISRSSSSAGVSKDSARTRRRLDYPGQPSALSHVPQNWDNLYTLTDASRTSFVVPISLSMIVLTLEQRRTSPVLSMKLKKRLVIFQ